MNNINNNIDMINAEYGIYEELTKNVYSDHTCSCNKNKKEY